MLHFRFEAAQALRNGSVRHQLDIDVVLLHGYGFPRSCGGPTDGVAAQGLDTILGDFREFTKTDNHFRTPAPLPTELVEARAMFDSLNRKDHQ